MEHGVYRSQKQEHLYELLTDKAKGLFKTKQAVMMFAAATGWYIKERKERDKGGELIRWDPFINQNDDVFIYLLALAESETIEILDKEGMEEGDSPVTIFEEYATAGLEYLKTRCINAQGTLLDNFLDFIEEMNQNSADVAPSLDSFFME
ncbi:MULTISPECIES: DNA phosphorothioation-associated protein 4 [Spirulina sp. CCY15215]|uniref:DNA phosphorothioation-associated protein 4 n=1 Tax=Spirulina sp. CCY15215 TaxID=2767591 RepID=UPI00194EC6F8|nr:DNA phosphorothioation-associated protein 4 [Spirulina major]